MPCVAQRQVTDGRKPGVTDFEVTEEMVMALADGELNLIKKKR